MNILSIKWLGAVLIFASVMQQQTFATEQEKITAGGAGTAMGSFKALALAYKSNHPKMNMDWAPDMGTAGALKALPKKVIDLAFIAKISTSDSVPDSELTYLFFAKTAVVFAVQQDVPTRNITATELIQILQAETEIWSNGTRIRPIMRLQSESDIQIIQGISPKVKEAIDIALQRQGMLLAMSNQESQSLIGKTPGAIGISSLAQIATEGGTLKALSFDGKIADLKSLDDGTYPLVKKLYIAHRKNASPEVMAFIEFIHSKEGKAILRKTGNSVTETTGTN